ncbi:phosphatase PAP2 family protein [Gemmobacter sp.]|uniref:phosphatase PAP2 family protein n=1 Tax=Gemmobacter sp. TaxID=1898957 RepID=UPI002AFE8D3B|nr:phosphatase PAP2 family protein [Gemmobacter sp.]
MTLGEMDAFFFAAIYGGADAATVVVMAAKLVAKVLIYCLPIHMVALWLVGDDIDKQTALALLLALICGLTASHLIGLGFYRPRPFLAGLGEALMSHRPSASFPSNHALVFSAYASTLILLRQYRLGIAIFVVGLTVCAARIYLGIHYPGDILGGLLLGTISAMASLWIWARWGHQLYRIALAIWECFPHPIKRLSTTAKSGWIRRTTRSEKR